MRVSALFNLFRFVCASLIVVVALFPRLLSLNLRTK